MSLFSFGLSNDSKDNIAGGSTTIHAPPLLRRSITSLSSNNSITSSNANAPESIFERSVQENVVFEAPKRLPSNVSLKGQFLKNEDYVAPALDATATLINSRTDLDNVEMIYSNRRNSSVLGLNMALGRNNPPSRKNSSYSIHQTASPISSPVSPKLSSSQSTLSFYSYAEMISEEGARRPTFKSSYSQGFIPTIANPGTKARSGSTTRMRGFLISPESSDEERDVKKFEKFDEDGENLVSSSMGECLRRTNTEIRLSEQ